MQDTITIAYFEMGKDMQRHPRTQVYECRLAAMKQIINLLDAGATFAVTHGVHDKHDAKPIRHVAMADLAMLA